MSDSNITKTVLNGAIDGAQKAADIALTATDEAVGMAASLASAPIDVGEKSADALLGEARSLINEALERIRNVANKVSEPLP